MRGSLIYAVDLLHLNALNLVKSRIGFGLQVSRCFFYHDFQVLVLSFVTDEDNGVTVFVVHHFHDIPCGKCEITGSGLPSELAEGCSYQDFTTGIGVEVGNDVSNGIIYKPALAHTTTADLEIGLTGISGVCPRIPDQLLIEGEITGTAGVSVHGNYIGNRYHNCYLLVFCEGPTLSSYYHPQ